MKSFCSSHSQTPWFRCQDDILAGELWVHQGGVRHQVQQDGGVDG